MIKLKTNQSKTISLFRNNDKWIKTINYETETRFCPETYQSFYDNVDFFKTVKEQRADGYQWEWNYKDRNPDVPAIPLQYDNGKEKVIWVLEK